MTPHSSSPQDPSAQDDAALARRARLGAYLDGELSAPELAVFEHDLTLDPALRADLDRERRLRDALRARFDPVLDEPVPERLRALFPGLADTPADAPAPVAPPAPVVNLAQARERRRPSPGWWAWGGMAASLVLGLLIGPRLAPQPELLRVADGGWRAGGALAEALQTRASGDATPGPRIGLSFVTEGGGYCRAFSTGADAGLACKETDGWRVRQLLAQPPASPASGDAMRTAASPWPPELLRQIDALRSGDPLGAAEERAAIDKGWR